MTETTPVGCCTRLKTRSLEELSEDEQLDLRTKQGVPVPGIEARIEGEDGELPHDGTSVGELCVRGPWVVRSYYETDAPFADCFFEDEENRVWFRTGDMATIDALGYIEITDRKKDLIKSRGEWISSVAMENAAMAHADVLEAAVTARPDPLRGEAPVLWIVPDPGGPRAADRSGGARAPRAPVPALAAAAPGGRAHARGDPQDERGQVRQEGAAATTRGRGRPGPRLRRTAHADVLAEWVKDVRTVLPHVRDRLFAPAPAPSVHWETTVRDPERGALRLTGLLREVPGARDLVVLVHGLGGSPDSLACVRGAEVLGRRGASTLCLALRGADRCGEDVYNIALTADLFAALASAEVRAYARVFVLGYSMGGYVALHFAHQCADPRLAGVAALCTPLDLHTAQRHIDTRRAAFYRRRVLRGLIEIYSAVAERGDVPTDPARVARVRTMYDWDRLTIAPRYGYDSPEHYYRALSIVPHLEGLRVPALHLVATDDPVVPPTAVLPFLPPASRRGERGYEVVLVRRAGHLAFPADLDLGFGAERGVDAQVHAWFTQDRRPH